MTQHLRRAAVVGAGTMGAQIAAHLANAGIPCDVLDLPAAELTAAEAARGLTLEDPRAADRPVRAALERMRALKPPPLFLSGDAGLLTAGNTRDHMDRLRAADWIIEAVVERLPVKRDVLAAIERHRRPGALVTSNTSGLSVNAMIEGRSPEFRASFCGTHFFNPPRYLHLLEIIPAADTRPEVVERLSEWGSLLLGKGIVVCRDTPYFIGNRIGCFAQSLQVAALEHGFTVDEIDAVTGEALLRPRSATFRLADIVGLDLILDVGANLHEALPGDEYRGVFLPPEFLQEMVRRGWSGEKSGQGFYRRERGAAGSEILTLDLSDWTYRPRTRPRFESVDAARRAGSPGERLRALLGGSDRAAALAWKVVSGALVYAALRAEEIADDIARVDDAMRWGWNWELGPFEQWDALGAAETARRLEEDGREVPPLVERVLADGGRFYRREGGAVRYFHFDGSRRSPGPEPGVIVLRDLKEGGAVVRSGPDASLVDLGEGVLCLEFHSKANTLGPGVLEMLRGALAEAERGFAALVIGNQGRMFSAGANLALLLADAEEGDWDAIDASVREFQQTLMAVKCCARPVVAAVHGRALGGGCELALQSTRIQAAAETYIGLVELAVGLIPAGGGCKEMVVRSQEHLPADDPDADRWSPLQRAFRAIGLARTSTSAHEARAMGLLRDRDGISIHPRRHLGDARDLALSLAGAGFRPYRPRAEIPVLGEPALARFKIELHLMRRAGHISDHDQRLGTALATVLCGGDLSGPRTVSEQYLLDLEREEFVRLCGEEKTRERIRHMLKTGRPLRN